MAGRRNTTADHNLRCRARRNALEIPKAFPVQRRTGNAVDVAVRFAWTGLSQDHHLPQVLLRIRADDASALCCLGSKYGADPGPAAAAALSAAAALGINVVGVSFHVGSASRNPQVC